MATPPRLAQITPFPRIRHRFYRDGKKIELVEPREPCRDPMAASIWHLLDLKRAGHSPTRTELQIEPGDNPSRINPHREMIHSPTGSPAASCAGN